MNVKRSGDDDKDEICEREEGGERGLKYLTHKTRDAGTEPTTSPNFNRISPQNSRNGNYNRSRGVWQVIAC